jgi:hypothetical protein
LRGTKGIILDLRRRPEKLLEALDVVAQITIDVTVATLNATRGQIALFPLHKGADGWTSRQLRPSTADASGRRRSHRRAS